MDKIIKFGFLPIKYDRERGQNVQKGMKLLKAGHVFNVTEYEKAGEIQITCEIMAQTTISNIYKVELQLDNDRNVQTSKCSCKAGLSGKCKHICALVQYINSPKSDESKTGHEKEWGKPSYRQILGYDKGIRISELFSSAPINPKPTNIVKPINITAQILGPSLQHTPLYKVLNLEAKTESEIIAAETLANIKFSWEKKNKETKAKQTTLDIFSLQNFYSIYSGEQLMLLHLNEFYEENVCCNINGGLNISVETIDQSESSKWFEERQLRITASVAHRLKGTKFNKDKVINTLLKKDNMKTPSMIYGKKMEDVALKEYESYCQANCKIINVGLIVSLNQPWLSGSPDAIATYGPNLWEKYLIEIKCPSSCKEIPIIQTKPFKINVKYIEHDENGFHLKTSHSYYTQVQVLLYVTSLVICHLFIYSPKGSALVIVKRDETFLSNIIPQLENFYFQYYLPKLYLSKSLQ